MSIALDHAAVIAYLDDVLEAFGEGRLSKDQARIELQTSLALAALDKEASLNTAFASFKKRWNVT